MRFNERNHFLIRDPLYANNTRAIRVPLCTPEIENQPNRYVCLFSVLVSECEASVTASARRVKTQPQFI